MLCISTVKHAFSPRTSIGCLSLENSEIEKLKKKYLRPPNQMGLARLKTFVLENSPAWLVVALMRRFITKSDYQSKRESVAFFRRANMAYGAHRQRRSVRLLRVAFGLLGAELSKDYSRLIIGATNQTQRDASRRSALSGEILEATKALPIGRTDATGWYQLSRGLFSVGYFRAAWVARENSIDRTIDEGKSNWRSSTSFKRCVEAYLERRDLSTAEVLLSKASNYLTEINICDLSDYLNLLLHKDKLPFLDPNSSNFEAEEFFGKLIYGKSVALVGPGRPAGLYGDEIDSADTVVRIKYVGPEHLPSREFHGSRCDINYFGDSELNALRQNLSVHEWLAYFSNVKMFLTSRTVSGKSGSFLTLNMYSTGSPYRTNSYAGVRTLFTLCRYKPTKLKLYGLNFYADNIDYSDENQRFLEKSAKNLGHSLFDQQGISQQKSYYRSRGFYNHDVVSNFCFAQNLYKAGLFEIEPYGASILALTPYQYVERLEEMLGDW